MGNISKNFDREEFACQGVDCCDNSAPVSRALIVGLQSLRDKIGPLKISSGFRCKKHNAKIGGAPKSYHTTGEAVDIKLPKGMTVDQLAAEAERIAQFLSGGVIRYPWGIHVDVRGTKYREDRR